MPQEPTDTTDAPFPQDAIRDRTWIVIPAYHEAATIADVVSDLLPWYPNVVVVDDGSTDDTERRAGDAGACVLRHVLNRGQGASLQTGISYALKRGAEYVVTYDADGQHRKGDIASLLEPLVAGRAQIALGSRFLGGAVDIPKSRWLLLKAGVVFTRMVNGVRVTDTHNGLRGFTRQAAAGLDIRLDRMAHASEIIDYVRRSGLPFVEVPVTIAYTEHSLAKGQSSRNAISIVLDYLLGRIIK